MKQEMRTHYEVLRVSRQALESEIKSSYRRLTKLYHPDATPGMEGSRFREICEAYKVLSNPTKRYAYDRELRARESENSPLYGPLAFSQD